MLLISPSPRRGMIHALISERQLGIVDQIVDGEDAVCNEPIVACEKDPGQALCKYRDQIDLYKMAAHLSVGPVFARHIGSR